MIVFFYDLCSIIYWGFDFGEVSLSLSAIVKIAKAIQNSVLQACSGIKFGALLDHIEAIVGLLVSVFTLVGVMRGLNFLKSVKEKQIAESFTFWSQIKVHIVQIYNFLIADRALLNNLYPPQTRVGFETLNSDSSLLVEFKNKVQSTATYLKNKSDQMPAYNGWSKDFSDFILFLTFIEQYDICNPDKRFVRTDDSLLKSRDDYYDQISKTMERLINGITERQSIIEEKMYPKKR